MENRIRVVVYGKTLSMAGIAASLKEVADLETICLDPHDHNTRQSLFALNPQTIIFDRTQPHPELDLALLREQPGLTLIGFDPSSDDVLVLTGQPNRIVSVNQLATLVSVQARISLFGEDPTIYDQGGSLDKTTTIN